MLFLDKNHDPKKNAELIKKFSSFPYDTSVLVNDTLSLLQKYCSNNQSLPKSSWYISLLNRFSHSASHSLKNWFTYVDKEGNVYPEWKAILDKEYDILLKTIEKEVNIVDFGAVGDGKTDNTKAFRKAIGKGRVIVRIPGGTYITKGIKLPSWTCLIGAGKGATTIKLHHNAPKKTRLLTNANHHRGNHHLFLQGLTLDWNVERLPKGEKTASGGNRSSCLTFANVTFGWIKDIAAVNAGLHGFDISASRYYYFGDGFIAPRRSQYIWLDHLTGYGFGDDGITTHHSDHIFISNSHMCDPNGRAHNPGFSNSNGIEIDDGSRNVWLANNTTARCFGGIELKAHHNASAASHITIFGHLSVHDNRSFNFRHIGHHKGDDPESKTAYHITAAGLVSYAPIFTDLYKDSTPRGMVVSAYQNVLINQFTAIGDPTYDFQGNPVMAIQYRAGNVALKNISIQGFKNAEKIKGKYLKL